MTKKTDALVAVCTVIGGIALAALVLIWAGFWSGLTISFLWGWFIIPLGLPAISLWHAYGLALIGQTVAGLSRKPAGDDNAAFRCLVQAPVAGAAMIAVGWVAKHWM